MTTAKNSDPVTFDRAVREWETDDWPSGTSRVRCRFYVAPVRGGGERVERVTEKPSGGTSAPRKLTGGRRAALLIGSDGKVYPATIGQHFESVAIMQSNMKYSERSFSKTFDPEEYERIASLIESAE